jgi:allantoin racemase
MSIKIWHQSMTDLTVLPGYAKMLAEHARSVCGPDTIVDIHGVQHGTYPPGFPPIEMGRYHWAHQLAFIQVVENARRAEVEGYDAFAITAFVDPALEDVRSLVDIPVVSSCETALLISSTVSRAPSLITLEESMARTLRGLVSRYGYSDRVVEVAAHNPPLTEHELDGAFKGSPEFSNRFAAEARTLIARGADLIIPAEGVLNSVLVSNKITQVDGVPVLDSYGSLIAFAEMLVQLRRKAGLAIARSGAYARPPASLIASLNRLTGDLLREPAPLQ